MNKFEKYAIAVEDNNELFLLHEVKRSASGDTYVISNKSNKKENPHSSYHISGQLHRKVYNRKVFPVKIVLPPTKSFQGSQVIINTSIRRGEGRAWGILCKVENYTDVMIIEDKILPPDFGYQFDVEIVQPNQKPSISTYSYARVIQQKLFQLNNPWIVASLFEMSTTPF